jgi:hypothetical protein
MGAICGVAFIGTQFLVGIGAGGFIGFGVAFWGWDEKLYDDYSIVISIVAIVVSVIRADAAFQISGPGASGERSGRATAAANVSSRRTKLNGII